jgi:hypothetical protein
MKFVGGCGPVSRKGKSRLIKDDMTGNDDTIRRKIETPVAFMIGGVPEEGT